MKPSAIACAALLTIVPVLAQQADIGSPPGRLIDVGGRRLHLNCSGSGSPTVVLEAGASSFAIDWSLVQPDIARTQRVCSYDRASSGWSDARPDVETPIKIVVDLNTALAAAGEKPPFVLVGASAGGLYVRLYQLDQRV
jgi:pimeloyl-ACP methyl ester carboxylesterase